MRDALLNQVVHAFQELQEHHGGEAGAGGVLAEVLAQGAGVAGGRSRGLRHTLTHYCGGDGLSSSS